mgnify:CR=1 FL=1
MQILSRVTLTFGVIILIAAALLCRRADVRGDPPALALAILTGIVGIGSFLFHTLAVHWSMLADVIPIALFIHGYFLLALRRFLGLGWPGAVAATLAFLAFGFGLTPALDWLSGLDTSAATNGSTASGKACSVSIAAERCPASCERR